MRDPSPRLCPYLSLACELGAETPVIPLPPGGTRPLWCPVGCQLCWKKQQKAACLLWQEASMREMSWREWSSCQLSAGFSELAPPRNFSTIAVLAISLLFHLLPTGAVQVQKWFWARLEPNRTELRYSNILFKWAGR